MRKVKIKIITTPGYTPGDELDIPVNENGIPLERKWRTYFRDQPIDNNFKLLDKNYQLLMPVGVPIEALEVDPEVDADVKGVEASAQAGILKVKIDPNATNSASIEKKSPSNKKKAKQKK